MSVSAVIHFLCGLSSIAFQRILGIWASDRSTMLITVCSLLFFFFFLCSIYMLCTKRNLNDCSQSSASEVAAVSSSSSSSSTSSSSSSSSSVGANGKYDVFLSFRGEDTRKGFVSHLYRALVDRGIHTFRDDERLERGKSIAPELLKAIEDSKIAIVVFSKNYASSSWCLDELVRIVECKEEYEQKIIIPVFYDVDPSDIRKQKNCVASALAKHRAESKEKLQNWRRALKRTANFSGWDVPKTANGDESVCVQKIVETVFCELYPNVNARKDLVGIECRMDKVMSMLRKGSDDVRIIGIWGMGGSGKTTIASALFRRLSNSYDSSCFLDNVGENAKKYGLKHLQESLLSKILKLTFVDISTIDLGMDKLKNRLQCMRVLIVLDNVDHQDQLKALAAEHDSFGPGSRLIITTRDKQLLLDVDELYKVDLLDENESMQLFSWYAFKKSHPDGSFIQQSYQVVNYAGGLPLALKVLGSHLRGEGMDEWSSAIRSIRASPRDEIVTILGISYDGLNDIEKRIFLDIGCFLKGMKEADAISILDSFYSGSLMGIRVLVKKSLMSVSKYGIIEMHDLIQEMGWNMVRQHYPRSRLRDEEEILDVLNGNRDCEAVEGIVLYYSERKDLIITYEVFKKMNKLRVLKFQNVCCFRGLGYLPIKLGWLEWDGCPLSSIPASFEGGKLVVLRMRSSRIVEPFREKKMFNKLKIMDFMNSRELRRTPDFSGLPCLEDLNLQGCTNLVKVHSSLGVHTMLRSVNLSFCKNLKILPKRIQMGSLKSLFLSFCLKLKNFPEIQGDINCFEILILSKTAIRELPSSIRNLTGLSQLILQDCKNLKSLPDSFCQLENLTGLNLSGCSNLLYLPPKYLDNRQQLQEKVDGDMSITDFASFSLYPLVKKRKVPWSSQTSSQFKKHRSCPLSDLTIIQHFRFPRTFVLPSSPLMRYLLLRFCNLSNLVIPENCLPSLKELDLRYNYLHDLVIPSNSLTSLDTLYLDENDFVHLPESIKRLSRLSTLSLEYCKRLETIQKLPPNLKLLYAEGCRKLTSINLHSQLSTVSLRDCGSDVLQPFPSLFDWDTMHGILRARDCKLEVHFPGTEIPEWFKYQGTGPMFVVTVPPSSHNEKFRGFAMCAIFDRETIEVKINDQRLFGDLEVDERNILFLYLPSQMFQCCSSNSSSPQTAQLREQICFLEAKFLSSFMIPKWGIRLVYEDENDDDNASAVITQEFHGPMNRWEGPHMKVVCGER